MAAALLATTAAAFVSTAIVPLFADLHRGALWGFVILVSFAGWGSLLAELAFTGRPADLGLRLAWGLGVLVVVGGLVSLVSCATRPALLALVAVGLALEGRAIAWRQSSDTRPGVRWSLASVLAFVFTATLAAVQYYGGATGPALSANDDFVSYLVFPRQILATGTLVEPFSVRRLAAYGGQSFLHALMLAGSPYPLQAPLLEMGICLIVVIALLAGEASGRGRLVSWFVPALVVLTMPNVRYNSTSIMSGVVLFLALFRTATWPGFDLSSARGAAVVGLLAAAVAALRHSYIVPAATFVVLLYGMSGVRRPAIAALAALVVFLLPWATLSYRSSGTPLYPLLQGYYRPEYGQLSSVNPDMDLPTWFWLNVRHCDPVRSLPLFLVAGLLLPGRRTRGALPALTIASLLGFIAIVFGFRHSNEWDMARYYFGFMVATTLAVTLHVCVSPPADWRGARARAAAILVLVAVAMQIPLVARRSFQDYADLLGRIRRAGTLSATARQTARPYEALQATIPAGAPLFAMLDRPFWLDFRRNPVTVIDLPGQVAPPPGMPLDDDDALAAYLARQGFRYLAFVRSTSSESLYRRRGWMQMLAPTAPAYWKACAPFYLKAFDRFESLATSRKRLYDDGKMIALDLAARTS